MAINLMLLGAIAMACFIAGVFFLRFWRTTHDRFFLCFAVSFCLEGICRLMLGLTTYRGEDEPLIYLLRLAAYVMILYAIVDKNLNTARPRKRIKH